MPPQNGNDDQNVILSDAHLIDPEDLEYGEENEIVEIEVGGFEDEPKVMVNDANSVGGIENEIEGKPNLAATTDTVFVVIIVLVLLGALLFYKKKQRQQDRDDETYTNEEAEKIAENQEEK